jgi:DNA-3-methyladenine glycosylase II
MPEIVNSKDIKKLISMDKIFAAIHEAHGAPPNWSRPQGFVSLCRIILEQQVSLASANAHFLKLNSYIEAFTPSHILKLSDTEMRACQMSRQKTKYLRELSLAINNGTIDLDKLSSYDEKEIRRQLTAIKGIGNWTTDIYLMFCLQSKDIFPVGDIAVINTIKKLCGVHTKEDILRLAEKWKPYRSLSTYYLWHHYLSKKKKPV